MAEVVKDDMGSSSQAAEKSTVEDFVRAKRRKSVTLYENVVVVSKDSSVLFLSYPFCIGTFNNIGE